MNKERLSDRNNGSEIKAISDNIINYIRGYIDSSHHEGKIIFKWIRIAESLEFIDKLVESLACAKELDDSVLCISKGSVNFFMYEVMFVFYLTSSCKTLNIEPFKIESDFTLDDIVNFYAIIADAYTDTTFLITLKKEEEKEEEELKLGKDLQLMYGVGKKSRIIYFKSDRLDNVIQTILDKSSDTQDVKYIGMHNLRDFITKHVNDYDTQMTQHSSDLTLMNYQLCGSYNMRQCFLLLDYDSCHPRVTVKLDDSLKYSLNLSIFSLLSLKSSKPLRIDFKGYDLRSKKDVPLFSPGM